MLINEYGLLICGATKGMHEYLPLTRETYLDAIKRLDCPPHSFVIDRHGESVYYVTKFLDETIYEYVDPPRLESSMKPIVLFRGYDDLISLIKDLNADS